MRAKTVAEVMALHCEIPAHLVADAEVPLCSGMQRQGDVLVRPARKSAKPGVVIPPDGVAVVRGENGGNTHLLVGDGVWAPAAGRDLLALGAVDVGPEGAYLLHPEHGAQGLAPGSYVVSRQREQADEIRRVAD